VPRRFVAETAARHAAQLVIDNRDQAVERRGISLTPGQKQFGDFVHPFDSLRSLRAGVERLIIRS
jgi:hypothetical protein